MRLMLYYSVAILTTFLILPVNSVGSTPLEKAAAAGDLEKVKTLVSRGANVNEVDEDTTWVKTPLFVAAEKGRVDVVAYLLAHGADASITNAAGGTPLRAAAYNGHARIVRLLLAHGSMPDEDGDSYGRTPMIWAIIAAEHGKTKDYIDIIKALRESGAMCARTFTHPVNDSTLSVAEIAQQAGEDVARAFSEACDM